MAVFRANYRIDLSNIDLNWYYRNFYDWYLYENYTVDGKTYADVLLVNGWDGSNDLGLIFAGKQIKFDTFGNVTGGTVTGLGELIWQNGEPLWAIEKVSISAVAIYQASLSLSNVDDFLLVVSSLSKNDQIYLSNYDDIFGGFGGNDALFGYAGSDLIDGGVGNDKLVGGIGDDTLIGGVGNDALTGGEDDDSLDGGIGNDKLAGDAGNDSLDGGAGKDTIAGGTGSDTLVSSGGGDTMTGDLEGGLERDFFVFNAAAIASNANKIADMTHDVDIIQLSAAYFAAIGLTLDADEFLSGAKVTKALDANDFILYDTKTGILLYDADGSGAGKAVKIATLSNKPQFLDHEDFMIV